LTQTLAFSRKNGELRQESGDACRTRRFARALEHGLMKKSVIVLALVPALLAACSSAPDSTNVADASNSAGAALENSAAELDATTDTLVDNEVGNINAASNDTAPADVNAQNVMMR
jgi:uncharacterized lipoprotein YajG